jgi:PAS domain S-box-containing protein
MGHRESDPRPPVDDGGPQVSGGSPAGRSPRDWLARPGVRTAAIALLVCAAYYVGARIGHVLRFPPITPSVLWPPNAILTATLLLTPPRRWWILLAALPAHVLIQLGAGRPTSLMALLFLTNCSEALIAAAGLHRFSDAPARFDTLRRVTVFIVAAGLAAPFFSSFADAAAVSAVRGESYWLVWRTRFFSNVLTELTLVPALVIAMTAGPRWIRRAPAQRWREAAILGVTLLFVAIMAFGLSPGLGTIPIPGSPYTRLALVLPLIFWAALRFGPAGVSFSLVTVVGLAIWAGTHGHGLFLTSPAAQAVLGLQVFLSVVTIPFMSLAGVLEEHRQTRNALAERLRFETLLSNLSAMFASGAPAMVDRDIEQGLRRIVEEVDVDRATLTALQPASDEVRVTHSWAREGVTPLQRILRGTEAPWIVGQLRKGHVVRLGPAGDVPADATIDRRSIERFGTRSGAVVPLVVRGVTVGGLAVATVREQRPWPDELVPRLRLLADVFARALERRDAERAVRESEERFRRMADSAPVMVWLSGPEGKRSYVNQRWLDFTGRSLDRELGDTWMASVHPEDQPEIGRVLSAALREGRPFTVEYRLARRDSEYRWVLDHGAPRRAHDGALLGYVGSAVDVTQLRAAQRALLETHLLQSAIFGSLYGHVAALDKSGRIIAVNQAWLRFAMENGGDPAHASIGASYIDACQRAADAGDPDARRIFEGVRSVLAGGVRLQLEYTRHVSVGERWYELTVEPLRRPEGGVLVTHIDVTRRRQAEEEAQREREALAHVLRITTLGELATSLAHEINQPLAAIVANAQATRRLLDAGRASRPGVVEALSDIVADAKRASQVIRRLRALFKKEHLDPQPVHLNEIVGDVVGLLRHDVERQRITVHCALAQGLEPVRGDPVQLQQVLLNVLVNACEAIAATAEGPREVAIETSVLAPGGVAVSIRDTGIGVKEADLERIFEHFVGTKAEGLGMGLAISRSIVQAHGGRIWATANADRGLTLHVELPGVPEPAPS